MGKKKASISLEIDSEVRDHINDLAEEFGITTSELIDASLRQLLRDCTMSYEGSNLVATKHLENILKEVDSDIKAGKNISPAFDNVDDMINHLEKTSKSNKNNKSKDPL